MFENFRREDIRLLTRTEYDRVSYEKVYSTILKEDCTAIVGLRRTGKTVMIKNTICDLLTHGVASINEILFITINPGSKSLPLTEHILNKLNINTAEYPSTKELFKFIEYCTMHDNVLKYKFIFVDEISYCRDFSINSKEIVDSFSNTGQKFIIAGTEYYLIKYANNESAFRRINFIDISYIPYIDYKIIKLANTVNTSKDNIINYLINPFFINSKTDTEYITNAISVNVAISAANSYTFESDIFFYTKEGSKQFKNLVEIITKLFTLTAVIPRVEEMEEVYPYKFIGFVNEGLTQKKYQEMNYVMPCMR